MNTCGITITLFLNLSCIGIALYVSVINIILYVRNEDSSAFQMKSYRLENSSQYPDISICFWAKSKIFNTRNLPFNISRSQMMSLLLGRSKWNNNYVNHSAEELLRHMAYSGREYGYYLLDQPENLLDTSFVISENQFADDKKSRFRLILWPSITELLENAYWNTECWWTLE